MWAHETAFRGMRAGARRELEGSGGDEVKGFKGDGVAEGDGAGVEVEAAWGRDTGGVVVEGVAQDGGVEAHRGGAVEAQLVSAAG